MSKTAAEWLRRNKLGHLVEVFERERITLDLFGDLTEADLGDLGMTIGDRKLFKRAMTETAEAGSDTPSPATPDTPALTLGTKAIQEAMDDTSERRLLTIVFIDLVGSTALSTRIDAEEFHDMLRSFLGTVKQITESYGGHVLKYLGDGVLSVFGWPLAHEGQSERAVLMCLEVVRAVQALTPQPDLKLKVRTGIASGSMVVGDIVDDVNDITGPAANLSQRLQSHAQPDEIVIDEVTRSTLPDRFVVTPLGALELKGFADPVEAFRVEAAEAATSRQRPSIEYAHPLLGRDRELGQIEELWAKARKGKGHTVVVQGEPGIGKTRLVREFVQQKIEGDHAVIWLQCFEYRSLSALFPLLQELMRSAGFDRGDELAVQRDKLRRFVEERCADPELAFALFAALLSIAEDEDVALLVKQVPDRARLALELFIELTLNAAKDQPVVVVLEDVHWADPSTINYCSRLAARLADQNILLLLVTRPEWVPPEDAFEIFETIRLRKLKRADSRRIVEQAIGKKLSPTVFEAILQRGEDVPLYLEELARVAADSLPGDELPPSIHSSMIARIDRLGADKPIMHLLAVLGLTFSLESLVEISNYDWATLVAALGRLVDAGMLLRVQQADRNRFQFRHALIQEAAYASVLRKTRRKLHEQVAEAFLERLKNQKFVDPEVLARHLSLASRPAEAIPFWQAAGDRLSGQSAYTEAAQQYEKGLLDVAKIPDSPVRDDHEYELRVRLSAALLTVEGWSADRVAENYEQALVLADKLKDPQKQFVAMRGRFNVLFLRGNLSGARELIGKLSAIAEETDDAVLIAEALKMDGGCAVHEANFPHAAQCLEKSIEIFPRSTARDQTIVFGTDRDVISLAHLAWANWFLDVPKLADLSIEKALNIAKTDEHAFSETYAEGFASCLCQFKRDVRGAKRHADNVIALSEKYHFNYFEGWGRILRGWSFAFLGEPEAGLEELDLGITVYRQSGAELILPYAYALRSEVLDLMKAEKLVIAKERVDPFPPTTSQSRFYTGPVARAGSEPG